MNRKPTLAGIVITGLLSVSWTEATIRAANEQTNFDSEQDYANQPVQDPKPLSTDALYALAKDQRVSDCLRLSGKSPDQAFAWFVSSEIHLAGKDETDFIVLPSLRSDSEGLPCFQDSDTAWFWALRKTRLGFELIFSGSGHYLSVSRHRTNGLRDIKLFSSAQVGGVVAEGVFRFDGQRYVQVKASEFPTP